MIRIIRMQIRTIRKGFEAFEIDPKYFNANSSNSKGIQAFECKFEPFESDSKHFNAN